MTQLSFIPETIGPRLAFMCSSCIVFSNAQFLQTLICLGFGDAFKVAFAVNALQPILPMSACACAFLHLAEKKWWNLLGLSLAHLG